MYWICFGDSAGGMLKCARGSCEPELPVQHIVPLLDDLSQGDLARLDDPEAGEEIVCPWQEDLDIEEGRQDKMLSRESLTFDICDEAVIWYGENAVERSGLLYVVSCLWPRSVPVWVVYTDQMPVTEQRKPLWLGGGEETLGYIRNRKKNGRPLRRPQWYLRWRVRHHSEREYRRNQKENRMIEFAGVATLEPDDALYFYKKRRRLTEDECRKMSKEWDTLCRENAPLRVLQSGVLRSACEDYYDGLILSEVPVQDTGAATVIGNVLGRHDLFLSDMLIYERLCGLIAQGKIRVVAEAPTYRDLVIRRGG